MTTPRPILFARRRIRVTAFVIIVGFLVTAWWALQPIPAAEIPAVRLSTSQKAQIDVIAESLDVAAFDAPIWRTAKKPDSIAQAAADRQAPPGISLRLIAITTDLEAGGSIRKAALYDPARNTLDILGEGDSAGGWNITSIEATEVILNRGSRTATLRLRDEKPPLRLGRLSP